MKTKTKIKFLFANKDDEPRTQLEIILNHYDNAESVEEKIIIAENLFSFLIRHPNLFNTSIHFSSIPLSRLQLSVFDSQIKSITKISLQYLSENSISEEELSKLPEKAQLIAPFVAMGLPDKEISEITNIKYSYERKLRRMLLGKYHAHNAAQLSKKITIKRNSPLFRRGVRGEVRESPRARSKKATSRRKKASGNK